MNKPEPDAKKANPPWGRWEVLLDEPTYKVKRVTVLPGKRLSYQKHFRRSEHWMVVEGKGMVTIDGKEMHIEKGNTVDIAREVAHRMTNNGDEDLTFIEIQQGEYFGEDDIIRLEDDYGRVSA
jgi:mannose-6-phosphate isomerase-like protein (cupin superfamily)